MLDQVFSPDVARWFAGKFGSPTPPQARGWPAIAAGQDTLIAAPTGSGKTLAAFLYCIDDLMRRRAAGALEDRTYVVYVSPLKALSNDIRENLAGPLAELGATDIRAAVRTGDTDARTRQLMAKTPPHILVTTPESLYILLTTKRGAAALSAVQTVIVDEIHALAGDRRGAHLALSLERLDALRSREDRPRRAQRIGLSATQKPIDVVGQFLTGGQPCTIVDEGHARELDLAVAAPEGELAAVCSLEQWDTIFDQIVDLVAAHRTTLVFVNTRRLVERVAHHLSARLGEESVAAHHGAMSRQSREGVEKRMRAGDVRVVIATASLELGIDVGDIDLVVQLGSPRGIARMLQRVGRAGHRRHATPKGRLFAMTRDDLVDCAALTRAVKAGRLDALCVIDRPMDILAQQIVAEVCSGAGEVEPEALHERFRKAYPYRNVGWEEFEQLVNMLCDAIATRRGRGLALVHRDRVQNKLRPRRGAKLAAVMSGGAIPDRADYDVIADPEGVKVGSLDEDFAIDSSPGDIFCLGNMSWRIKRVEANRVRVEDARGQPPTIPFWFGEAPGRTIELSEEVARLRSEVEDGRTVAELAPECGLSEALASQLVDYLKVGLAQLGCLPTQRKLVAERFFDESGGTQLVVHAPFGSRLNRAWGLALRKSFCQTFDFELQAVATDDAILLSLGPQHSFPLETIFGFVRSATARKKLLAASLQAPVFETRWRWNATRSLSVLRMKTTGRVPPHLVRMRADDLLAACFPAQVGCQDNHGGQEVVPPDHPLVNQTVRDCLEEAMDLPGLERVLRALESGEIEIVARETPEPSVLCHEILAANPYAFLDDAPLEERRARAVSVRRGLPSDEAAKFGALDADAIAEVRGDACPTVRDADELHDALCLLGVMPAAAPLMDERRIMDDLVADRRATRLRFADGAELWVAADLLPLAQTVYGDRATLAPVIAAAPGARIYERDDAVLHIVRGHMECAGPVTEVDLAAILCLPVEDVALACARLEGDGAILRGRFTPEAVGPQEWCDRRLLARIHRMTLGRLRREIEPAAPADHARFLLVWQRLAPGSQLHGVHGVETVLRQLQGIEAPVAAWERDILPCRIAGYEPGLLDELCLSGDVVWGRRSATDASRTTRATPISLWLRASTPWMLATRPERPEPEDEPARAVLGALRDRGALFYGEVAEVTGLPRPKLDAALWALVCCGWLTADGFGALRTLADCSPRRTGRWSILGAPAVDGDAVVDAHARQLLARYGVVWRELVVREPLPPWRDILLCLRRLEARGEVRGGRFVAGVVGEQFALATAVDALRTTRRGEHGKISVATDDPVLVRSLPMLRGKPAAPLLVA